MAPIYTADFVGLDVHKAIVDNIYQNTVDYAHETFKLPNYVQELIKKGNYGVKTKKGLYDTENKKVYDIVKKEYRDIKKYDIKFIDEVIENFKIGNYQEGIDIIFNDISKEAKICQEFLIGYIIYSIKITKEITNNQIDCDTAMAEGFNWIPPYALLEIIGKDRIKKVSQKLNIDINEMLDEKTEYKYEKFLKAKR